jgi:hypothetical protein
MHNKMNTKITTLMIATFLCCCNSLFPASAKWVWEGNFDSDWTRKGNWSTTDNNATVGSTDTVIINDGAAVYPFLLGNVTMRKFIMNGGYCFSNGYNFTVSEDITIYDGFFGGDDSRFTSGDLFLYGGELHLYGNQIKISDDVVIDGGTLKILSNNAVIPDDLFLRSGTLNLNTFNLLVTDEYTYEGTPFTFQDPGVININNLVVDFTGSDNLGLDMNVLVTATFIDGIINTSPAAKLIFDNNASANGASNTSHINGPVRRLVANSGNTAFQFPVGDGTVFAPIAISDFAQTRSQDYFTAQYYKANAPYNHNSKDFTLDHISSSEYWILDRNATAGTPTTDVVVGLSYDETNRSGTVTTATELRVARWDGSSWKDHGRTNTGATGNNVSGSFNTLARVTSFSPFTLASSTSLNPLPVTMMNFEAIPAGQQIEVKWSTMSEIDNDYFTVQKSIDGKNWLNIGTVDGNVNAGINNYMFMDLAPVKGMQYYRLIQTDINGQTSLSEIVKVNIAASVTGTTVTVFPNPVVNLVSVTLSEPSSDAGITVFNSMGLKVLELNHQSGHIFNVDMTTFERGIYTIEVKYEGGVSILKILKN